MSKGFIKNEDILAEDYRVIDLFDFSSFQTKLKNEVDRLTKPSIVAIVGKFGIGKSTMLYNLSQCAEKNEKWIQFDAWKYPDRKNLWEGFVLDFAEQVGEKKEVIKKIDGTSAKSKWVDLATDIASGVSSFIPKEVNFLDKFVNIFQKSPATRVFQLQDILRTLIKHIDQNLYIVIEDIDRSGDKGVFFLETLKQFLQSLSIDKKIIVFVPISDDSYYDKNESYLKTVDVFNFFEHKKFFLENFVNKLMDFSTCNDSKCKTQIISFLEQLFIQFPEMTPRKLKLILRRANLIFQSQVDDKQEPDLRITICIESAKYFKISKDNSQTYFQSFVESREISGGNVFNSLLLAILNDNNNVTAERYDESVGAYVPELFTGEGAFKFIERKEGDVERYPSIPWNYDPYGDEDDGLGITKFYVEY